MEIIIVRHGVTKSNISGITNGQLDEPLTKQGHKQAFQLAKRLEHRGIEKIYSSPLKRTSLTALPIAEKLELEVNIDRRLIEVNFGKFEGQNNEVMIKELGKGPKEFLNSYEYDFSDFGGESSFQVAARVKSFIEDLKKKPYKKVLIVTHGGILRWIYYIVAGEKIGPRPNAEEFDLKL